MVVDPDTGETRFAVTGAEHQQNVLLFQQWLRDHPERMSRAAVLGRPVAHSLSPVLHRAAYAALGLTDWTYDALDIGAEDLPVLLAGLGRGVARVLGDDAVQAGGGGRRRRRRAAAAAAARGEHAGPHRRRAGGRRTPTSAGIGMALQLAGVEEVGAATIIGAGGTAAAAAVALASLGAEHVDVVVRDPARAGDVTRVLDVLGVPFTVTPLAGRGAGRPAGGQHRADRRPARPAAHLPWRGRAHRARRALRPLADAARRSGSPPSAAPWPAGLEVLFWQATAQVELMTGQPAPIAAMRERPRRRRRRPLTPPWRLRCCSSPPCSWPSSAGPGWRGSPPGWPPATTPPARTGGTAVVMTVAVRRPAGRRRAGSPAPARRRPRWPGPPAPPSSSAAVDLASHRLPDRVTYPAAPSCAGGPPRRRGRARLLGCAPAGPGGRRGGVRRRLPAPPRSRPAALGFGDVKLLGLLGLLLGWFGWGVLLAGVFLGLLTGAVVSLALLATRRAGWRTALPFGPPLLLGGAGAGAR